MTLSRMFGMLVGLVGIRVGGAVLNLLSQIIFARLFLPEEAEQGAVPVLWYLSGLTCTHENAMVKAGAQRWAAEAGIALIFPDTSPRGEGVANAEEYDLGQGAGFYVNATETPWAPHFRMWDHVTEELPRLLFNAFPVAQEAQAITGHSMETVQNILDAHYLGGRVELAESAIKKLNAVYG